MDNSPKKPSRWLIVWAGLSILLPLMVIYIYSCCENPIKIGSLEIKQVSGNQDVDLLIQEIDKSKKEIPKKPIVNLLLDSNRKIIASEIELEWLLEYKKVNN